MRYIVSFTSELFPSREAALEAATTYCMNSMPGVGGIEMRVSTRYPDKVAVAGYDEYRMFAEHKPLVTLCTVEPVREIPKHPWSTYPPLSIG